MYYCTRSLSSQDKYSLAVYVLIQVKLVIEQTSDKPKPSMHKWTFETKTLPKGIRG